MIGEIAFGILVAYLVISVLFVFWKIIWRVAFVGVIAIAALQGTGVLF